MQMFENFADSHKIRQDEILNYTVIKIIRCSHCGAILKLENTTNLCKCDTVYSFMGNKITPEPHS